MLEMLTSPDAWIALATLTALEIVLGIDNIIFLSLVAGKLDAARRPRARRIGLALALLMRIALLSVLSWVISLSKPVIVLWGDGFSWRDLIFAAGGLFLLTKSTREIHTMMERNTVTAGRAPAGMLSVILQIALFDIVFSIDSVVTAIGMAEQLWVMIAAVMLAIGVMLVASEPVAKFVERRPTVKMLALSFLLLIGTSLLADAAHFHIPRGYLYFAMAFSAMVEILNQFATRRRIRRR
jgi:predicted tellurium resistance membrane protein TerC